MDTPAWLPCALWSLGDFAFCSHERLVAFCVARKVAVDATVARKFVDALCAHGKDFTAVAATMGWHLFACVAYYYDVLKPHCRWYRDEMPESESSGLEGGGGSDADSDSAAELHTPWSKHAKRQRQREALLVVKAAAEAAPHK